MNYDLAKIVVGASTIIVLTVSIVIAYRNLKGIQRKNEQDDIYRKDKEIVDQCVLILQRSFETFKNPENEALLPESNRLRWLTSARMILRYYSLKSTIVSELYKLVCEEHEEYWSHKYYLAIDHDSLDFDYFSPKAQEGDNENIDGRSAMIIVGFTRWKKEKKDPIDEFNCEKAIKEDGVLNGIRYRGLKNYLKTYSQYKKLIDEKIDS